MGNSKRKIIFLNEILFNKLGQIGYKKRFFFCFNNKYYRFIFGGS